MAKQRLLVVVPPHAASMSNGPPLAPFLVRHFLEDESLAVEVFDANAFFFRWLLSPQIRKEINAELQRQLAQFLASPKLSRDDLTTVGRLLTFLSSDYSQGRDFASARSGFDWAGVTEVLLDPPSTNRDPAWRDSLWVHAIDQITESILETCPDHVAFSALFHTQVEYLVAISSKLRQAGFPGRIVVGGSAIKLSGDSYLATLLRRSGADVAYKFNLYETFASLRAYLLGLASLENVEAISYIGPGGRLIHVPTQARRTRALAGPLSYEGVDLKLYFRDHIFPVLLSEGCYWGRCEFCDYPFLASQDPFTISALFRAPATLVADAHALADRYGVEHIDLISDAVPINYFSALRGADGEQLRVRGLHLGCSIRAEPRARPQHFGDMAACGVDSITIGVESLCDDILAGMKKGNTYEDVLRSLRMAREAGIAVKANIIYDYPRMQVHHVEQTRKRLAEIAPLIDGIGIHSFGLTPHAPLAYEPSSAGLRVVGEEDSHSNDHGAHHLKFVRTDITADLKEAFEGLRQELVALSFVLEQRKGVVRQASRVVPLPFRWSDDGYAIYEAGHPNIMVQIPGESTPFSFFVGEHV